MMATSRLDLAVDWDVKYQFKLTNKQLLELIYIILSLECQIHAYVYYIIQLNYKTVKITMLIEVGY